MSWVVSGYQNKNICLHLKHLGSYHTTFGDGCEEFIMAWFLREKTLHVKPSNESIRTRGSKVYTIRMNYSGHFLGNEFKSYVGRKESVAYIPKRNGGHPFEISDEGSRVVNLESKSCSCRSWDLTVIPCCHAVAACSYMGATPEEFVNKNAISYLPL
ncbi:hypothetical protein M9H77_03688 [Catharanthus roseus]|uniref:Uncharacterized protein n=1 Tax=Catharanthus roseus TaxID=4058 RepID=A0ACC0CC08_CATRO|nr:hypothetical protein M9H77_03688 [Catharanthus roseus]